MLSPCSYCQSPNAPFQCSHCKFVRYCSKLCQAKDWKASHRKACQAWTELQQYAASLTPQQAHQELQQAQEVIREMDTYLRKHDRKKIKDVGKTSFTQTGKTTLTIGDKNSKPLKPDTNTTKKAPFEVKVKRNWQVTLEEMTHLDSYQVTLIPPKGGLQNFDLQVVVHRDNQDSIVAVGDVLFWTLRNIEVTPNSCELVSLVDCLSVRIQCSTSLEERFGVVASFANLPNEVVTLTCKSCNTALTDKHFNHIVPAVEGYWDDMTDYLQCYPGQAAIQFGETRVPPNTAWMNGSVIMVESTAHVSALSGVEPYGVSPDHVTSWRPSSGGTCVTLCCNTCCAPVGIATQQGHAIYRHLLQDSPASSSISHFVAKEVHRYASSYGVYALVVANDSDPVCWLLHAVSWNAHMVHPGTGQRHAVVKVLYQESKHLPLRENDVWPWDKVDLCCGPTAVSNNKFAVMQVSHNEWEELGDQLKSRQYYFASEVVQATVMVKWGKFSSGANVGMAALDLW